MADLRKAARGRECKLIDIAGFEGRYQITDHGDVISLITGKTLSPGVKPGGYKFVGLRAVKGAKPSYKMIHRLVAESFIPNPLHKPEINHIDGDKKNNKAENLEWVTRNENAVHGFNTGLMTHGFEHHFCKLTPQQVISIYSAEGKYRDIGKLFGVCAQTVCNIKKKTAYRRFLEGVNV